MISGRRAGLADMAAPANAIHNTAATAVSLFIPCAPLSIGPARHRLGHRLDGLICHQRESGPKTDRHRNVRGMATHRFAAIDATPVSFPLTIAITRERLVAVGPSRPLSRGF